MAWVSWLTSTGRVFIVMFTSIALFWPWWIMQYDTLKLWLFTTSQHGVLWKHSKIIFWVGFPKEILTDQGSTFMPRTPCKLYKLLRIKSVHSSVYHSQTDGLVEWFNQTLKNIIQKFVHEDTSLCLKYHQKKLGEGSFGEQG